MKKEKTPKYLRNERESIATNFIKLKRIIRNYLRCMAARQFMWMKLYNFQKDTNSKIGLNKNRKSECI